MKKKITTNKKQTKIPPPPLPALPPGYAFEVVDGVRKIVEKIIKK